MLRRKFIIFAIFTASASAALLPERFGNYTRGELKPVSVPERPIWDEYGFDSAEQATYKSGSNQLVATAYRMKDPTGAFAAFEWLRPSDSTPIKLAEYAASYRDTSLLLM